MNEELTKKLLELIQALQDAAPYAVQVCASIAQANAVGRLLTAVISLVLIAALIIVWRRVFRHLPIILRDKDDFEEVWDLKRRYDRDFDEPTPTRVYRKDIAELYENLLCIFGVVSVLVLIVAVLIVWLTIGDIWTWYGIFRPELACAKNIVDTVLSNK